MPVGAEVPRVLADSPTADDPFGIERYRRIAEQEQQHAERREREIEAVRQHKQLGWWNASGLLKRHAEKARELAEASAGEWGAVFDSLCDRLGSDFLVALLGGRGTGKTQLGACLIRAAIRRDIRAVYVRLADLFDDVRGGFDRDTTASHLDRLRRYQAVPLLVLDECHEYAGSGFEGRTLRALIDQRYGELRPTVLISNEMPDAFSERMGPSIMSRLTECGEIIVCDWPSYRGAPARET